jgi:ankyrin repeat protein
MVGDSALLQLMRAIAAGVVTGAREMLAAEPSLASGRLDHGATRQDATDYFLHEIAHYVYAGDTALHVAAAACQASFARSLVLGGANVTARNRRGAEPLHYDADGAPGGSHWDPEAQAATITYLIEAGADPDATDISGVAPLPRAVRTRCATAVPALLAGGADPNRPNRTGSTPMMLATKATGKGGAGSPESKAQQHEIIELLRRHGAQI